MWWNTPAPQAPLQRFAERLEHLGVCGLNQPGEANICDCASNDRRRKSDLMLSSNAKSRRPSIHAATASISVVAAAIRRCSRRFSARAVSRKTAATSSSLESKCR